MKSIFDGIALTLEEATALIELIGKIPEGERDANIVSSLEKLVSYRQGVTGFCLD